MSDIFDNPAGASSSDISAALSSLADGNFIRAVSIGRSVCGRSITALELGSMIHPTVIVGGTHGMEWATVLAALRLAQKTAQSIKDNTPMHGISLREALAERGAVILPLLNPDGYEIRREGRSAAPRRARLLSRFIDALLAHWQSNANGIDLNHNFNAGFYTAKKNVADIGIIKPGPTRYGGLLPFSQPETRAIRNVCQKCRPRTLYALHSQGEEIYWRYGKNIPAGSEYMANLLAQLSGYRLCEPDDIASHAGLKDWFIKRYNRPGYTLELGLGQNPLPYSDFDSIWDKVARALFVALIL